MAKEDDVNSSNSTKIDIHSPYYLSPQDALGALNTHVKLRSDNYEAWCRSVRRALKSRRKFGFCDGTITKPKDETLLDHWEVVNCTIVQWLMNTIDDSLKDCIPYFEEANPMWTELAERFSVIDGTALYNLKTAIVECKQSKGMSVTEYYGKLKTLWESLAVHEPLLACTCGDAVARQDRERLHQFFMGLDASLYRDVRSQQLQLSTPPTVSLAFQVVLHEERLRAHSKPSEDAPDIAAYAVQVPSSSSSGPDWKAIRERHRLERSKLLCSYCDRRGHDLKSCFFKNNTFPDWWGSRSRALPGDAGRARSGGQSQAAGPSNSGPGGVSNRGQRTLVRANVISSSRVPDPDATNDLLSGMAADPMSMRRGGKKLPMEDVCYYQWPRPGADQADDIERPLLNEDSNLLPSHRNKPEDSLVLDIGDPSQDIMVGETLRRPLSSAVIAEEQKYTAKEDLNYDPRYKCAKIIKHISPLTNVRVISSLSVKSLTNLPDQGSGLSLEVVTGPASGLYYSVTSTEASKLPLTLGRVPPSGLLLKDSEISGKHARINWNPNNLKWELVDMGSLNGTLLNSKAINHPDSGSRTWGEPKELADGDVITLGTTSQINVQITSSTEAENPVWIGMAADPMSMRRGGKKLPMEDVCYYQWPLPGADQFGVFGICDGHGGALAAKDASKILPETIATALSDSITREKVLSRNDASEVLMDAFFQTEARLNYYYEGCTATVLLVWVDGDEGLFAQCANVGDSACVLSFDGKQLKMSEDHRITNISERQRINEVGEPLKDGDTRLCGLNLGRMLGDKFLKEQDGRFSSKPYISQVVRIDRASDAFALLASDGLWDVISVKKAVQLTFQARERHSTDVKDSAEKIANYLLNEARALRTKDNTSIVYVDFDTAFRTLCK